MVNDLRIVPRRKMLKYLVVALGLPIVMWACGGRDPGPVTFTAPTAFKAPPSPTFVVSGTVFERTSTGTRPVGRARVDEVNIHRGVDTDQNGFYSLAGLHAGSISLSASGSSYYVATITFELNGDVTKDIEIVPVKE